MNYYPVLKNTRHLFTPPFSLFLQSCDVGVGETESGDLQIFAWGINWSEMQADDYCRRTGNKCAMVGTVSDDGTLRANYAPIIRFETAMGLFTAYFGNRRHLLEDLVLAVDSISFRGRGPAKAAGKALEACKAMLECDEDSEDPAVHEAMELAREAVRIADEM